MIGLPIIYIITTTIITAEILPILCMKHWTFTKANVLFVKKYSEDTGNTDFWVAIYNCDSRLDKISLNEIFYNINNAKNQTVFQQYSYYHIPGSKGFSIPLSSAVWQTRWSVFKENAMARNRCLYRRKIKKGGEK